MDVWRPCDPSEAAVPGWPPSSEGRADLAIAHAAERPFQNATLIRSRRSAAAATFSRRPEPKAVIVATGSEVQLAVGAKQKLAEEGIRSGLCRCLHLDVRPPAADYRDVVLIRLCPRSPSSRVSDTWRKYVGLEGGGVVSTATAIGPRAKLFEHFGFTVDNVVKAVKKRMK